MINNGCGIAATEEKSPSETGGIAYMRKSVAPLFTNVINDTQTKINHETAEQKNNLIQN